MFVNISYCNFFIRASVSNDFTPYRQGLTQDSLIRRRRLILRWIQPEI